MLGSCVLSYLRSRELLLVLGLVPSRVLLMIRRVGVMCNPSICFVCSSMLAIKARSLLMSLFSAAVVNNLRVGVVRDELCSPSCAVCVVPGVVCSFIDDDWAVIVVCRVWLLVFGAGDVISLSCVCASVEVVRFLSLTNNASASSCIFVCMAMLGVRCPSPCSCRQYDSRVCIQWSMEHVGSMSPFGCSHGCRSQSGHAQWNSA